MIERIQFFQLCEFFLGMRRRNMIKVKDFHFKMRQVKRLPDFEINYDLLEVEKFIPPGKYLVLGEANYTIGSKIGSVFRLVDFNDLNTKYHLYGDIVEELIKSRKDYFRTKLFISKPDPPTTNKKGKFLTDFENPLGCPWKRITWEYGESCEPSCLQEAAYYLDISLEKAKELVQEEAEDCHEGTVLLER